MLLHSSQPSAKSRGCVYVSTEQSQSCGDSCLTKGGVSVSQYLPKNSRERLTTTPIEYLTDGYQPLQQFIKDCGPAVVTPRIPGKRSSLFRSWVAFVGAIASLVIALGLFRSRTFSASRTPSSSTLLPRVSELTDAIQTIDTRIATLVASIDELRKREATRISEEQGFRKIATQLDHAVRRLTEDNERLKIEQRRVHELKVPETLRELNSELERIDSRIHAMSEQFDSRFQKLLDSQEKVPSPAVVQLPKNSASDIDTSRHDLSEYKNMLQDLYRAVYLDGTGKPDWARAALGGSVIDQFTSPPRSSDAWNRFKWSLIPFFPRYYGKARPRSRPADIVIGGPKSVTLGYGPADRFKPGHCFAFDGARGNITLRLPTLIHVEEVHLDHVPPQLLPSSKSAPHRFSVYIDDCNSIGCHRRVDYAFPPSVPVGNFEFSYPQEVGSTFVLRHHAARPIQGTRRIRFEFLSNHGGEYTCIYRLRVHGSRVVSHERDEIRTKDHASLPQASSAVATPSPSS